MAWSKSYHSKPVPVKEMTFFSRNAIQYLDSFQFVAELGIRDGAEQDALLAETVASKPLALRKTASSANGSAHDSKLAKRDTEQQKAVADPRRALDEAKRALEKSQHEYRQLHKLAKEVATLAMAVMIKRGVNKAKIESIKARIQKFDTIHVTPSKAKRHTEQHSSAD